MLRRIKNKSCNKFTLSLSLLSVGMFLVPHKEAAFAQISSDGTLPNNSQINKQGNIYNITGGKEAGNNLFHSFDKFSVPNGSEAYFNNNLNIQNIFGRVTGKSISEINGLIRANGTANLFLMNPNGIVFGENAKLNIGGSFTATTAEAFKFSDGKEFSAVNPEDKPLLSVNVPLGLQYGKNQNASITNSGNLTVNNGKNITLIGNSFENQGNLAANNGQISIAAIANQGFANLGASGELLSLVSQPVDRIDNNTSNIGTVINRGSINTSNLQSGNGGKIIVLGEKIGLLENSFFNTSGNAGGGEVIIGKSNTTATYIGENAFIKADALNTGDGGNITVFATESTRAYGTLSARGGLNNGNGGFVQTTGSNFLDVKDINVDTNSNNGLSGNWLLGSSNIFLGSGDSLNSSSNSQSNNNFAIFQPGNSTTALDISTISKNLETGNNITIAATKTGNQEGNIKSEKVSIIPQNNNPVLLTFQADNDIVFPTGNIQSVNQRLGIVFQADSDNNGKGSISFGNGVSTSFVIDTKGGIFRASAASILFDGAEIMSKNTSVNDSEEMAIATPGSAVVKNSGIIQEKAGVGNSGDININVNGSITLRSSGIVQETDNGINGGDINIKADSLSLQGGINNNTNGNGDAGNINLQVNYFSLKKGAISSITNGSGRSGLVTIEADALDFNMGLIRSLTTGDGDANDVVINTGTASFKKSGLSTETVGKGHAGNIFINADDKILLGKNGFLNSGSTGLGDSGEITINSGSLILDDARIGSNSDNENGLDSIAIPGNIDINADSILLQNNSTIASITFSDRNAGKITLEADNITLRNSSNIVTKTAKNSTGNAGKIIVKAGSILFENELQFINENPKKINSLSSNTEGTGNAGIIEITADKIILRNKGGIGIDTESEGDAGKLTLKTSLLQVENSRIEDDAGIDSSSTEKGEAGELDITADKIVLDNSDIKAQTESGKGGNINLNFTELLLLRNNSAISTEAGSLGGGSGSGGDINIDAPDGFIVAVPNENSDITANAFEGTGGNITITAAGIYGIQFREERTPITSDINASSELGIDGNVEINTPDLTSDNKLAELPSIPITSELAQGCYSPGYAQNQFFIVGRGGLPPKPEDIFTPSAVRVEWVNPESNNKNSLPNRNIDVERNTKKPKRIVEATGWILNEKGEIIFTADAPVIATGDNSMQSNNCELVREVDK